MHLGINLPNNNPVMPFETGNDIISILREQWAGLFQRLLQDQSATGALETARELRRGIETAKQLVDLLKSDKDSGDLTEKKIEAVLLPNHPAFSRVQKILKVPYRVYFTNIDELNSWLKVRNFTPVKQTLWDSQDYREWINSKNDEVYDLLKISESLFENGGGFRPDKEAWVDALILREVRPRETDDISWGDD